jgi:hypothetical protein
LPNKICANCGAINYACLSFKKDPKRFWCCHGGSTVLPSLGNYPELLKALLTETVPTSNGGIKRSPRSKAFHSLSRQYNNAFVFTSLGVSFDEKLLRATEGVYSFRIHGVLYHQMGPLEHDPGNRPGWAQVYLYDSRDERLNKRLDYYDELDAGILSNVQDVLERCNPLCNSTSTIPSDCETILLVWRKLSLFRIPITGMLFASFKKAPGTVMKEIGEAYGSPITAAFWKTERTISFSEMPVFPAIMKPLLQR